MEQYEELNKYLKDTELNKHLRDIEFEKLISQLKNDAYWERDKAVNEIIVRLKSNEKTESEILLYLLPILMDRKSYIRHGVARIISYFKNDNIMMIILLEIILSLKDDCVVRRKAGISILVDITCYIHWSKLLGSKYEDLLFLLNDEDFNIRADTVDILCKIAKNSNGKLSEKILDRLIPMLKDNSMAVQRSVVYAIINILGIVMDY